MRKFLLICLFSFICASAHAAELSKVTEHEHGWSFLFFVNIKTKENPEGKKIPIEIPYNKCEKGAPNKNCLNDKREATNAAWASVKKMEKTMREALKGT